MEHLAALGTDIGQNAIPTFKTYGPLLGAAAPTFFKPQTYRYSSDESITRHELDVYLPEPEAQGKNPVMVFVHGGGLVKGDKQMPFPGAHQNVGTFFAKRGYITVSLILGSSTSPCDDMCADKESSSSTRSSRTTVFVSQIHQNHRTTLVSHPAELI